MITTIQYLLQVPRFKGRWLSGLPKDQKNVSSNHIQDQSQWCLRFKKKKYHISKNSAASQHVMVNTVRSMDSGQNKTVSIECSVKYDG